MGKTIKKPEEYLREPYSRILIPDEESGTYTAIILEFPGCIAQGDTPQEAYNHLEDTAKGWIEAALALNQEIPSPSQSLSFGGRVLLRLPKSLHRRLALIAEREGVSLNQFIVSALSEKIGAFSLYDKLMKKLDTKMFQVATTMASNTSSSVAIFLVNPFDLTEVQGNAGNQEFFFHPQRSSGSFNKIQ